MASAVYLLCALTAILCAWLLLQAYFARGRYRLLLWSGLCFVGLMLGVVDATGEIVWGDRLLAPNRSESYTNMAVLLYGLVMNA